MSTSKEISRLHIDPSGDVHAIHDDFVDSLDLGHKTVTRISDVEFDGAHQKWVARFRDSSIVVVGTTRKEVLDEERRIAIQLMEERHGIR